MTKLLNAKEVRRRLDSGETPLFIARDKWLRICEIIEKRCDDTNLNRKWMVHVTLGADSCALCVLYLLQPPGECKGCPIDCSYTWYSFVCRWTDYSLHDFGTKNDLLVSARRVLKIIEDAIQELKND